MSMPNGNESPIENPTAHEPLFMPWEFWNASDFLVPDGLDKTIWKRLLPEERFYIKGVEIEAHGEYRDGVYQEFAGGFGIRDYRGLLGSGAANQTRLKKPGELKGRDLSDEGFAGSLLR